MIMVKESRPNGGHIVSPYTIEVQAFELEKINLSDVSESRANHTSNRRNASDRFTLGAKLLQGVEKSYDKGKKVLDESKKEGVSFRLSDTRLRELEEGETCKVERIFTENKSFDFTSGEKIEAYEDVAFIFKQLQDESIENTFAVLVKEGKPTVIHLGMGSYTQSMVNGSALNVAVERVQPDKIYFVHNHPSGQLRASQQD